MKKEESSPLAQHVKNSVSSLLWHGFSPWPRNFCMLCADKTEKKKKKKKRKDKPRTADGLSIKWKIKEADSPLELPEETKLHQHLAFSLLRLIADLRPQEWPN